MDPNTMQTRATETRAGRSAPELPRGMSSGPLTAQACRERTQELLDAGEIREARRLAEEAATRFSDDAYLRQTHHLLNEYRATTGPATGQNVPDSLDWLRDPPEEYRGRWVALVGREVVASGATFKEMRASLPSDLVRSPLAVQVAS